MVILGAAGPYTGISGDSLITGIRGVFQRKGKDIVDLNIRAFGMGREMAGAYLQNLAR